MRDADGVHDAGRFADRYEIGELIGEGGMGRVHRALDRVTGRAVAVKTVPPASEPAEADRRRREVLLLAAVSHPGLVALLDAVETPQGTRLVMELVEGGTLRDRIEQRPLNLLELEDVALHLADALAHVHAAGIVHRDVKPANVLLPVVAPRGPLAAKLADFGVAKLLEAASQTTGGIVTVRYLSPEQARGGAVGPASDVYSLGLTLVEAAGGRDSADTGAVAALRARLLHDPVPPRGLPAGWRALLAAMTARHADRRPSAQQVARRVQRLIEVRSAPEVPTQPILIVRAVPAG